MIHINLLQKISSWMFSLIKLISQVVSLITEMILLSWEAHPLFFFMTLLLTVIRGLLPLASVWLTKYMFDVVAALLQTTATDRLYSELVFLLAAYIFISAVNQSISPLAAYLGAELRRNVEQQVYAKIYHKVNSFTGVKHFDNSSFHDQVKLAIDGALIGAVGTIDILISLIQSIITLFGLIWILVALNPVMILLIIVIALPQTYGQWQMSTQRFQVAVENSTRERKLSYYNLVLSGIPFAKELKLYNLADYFLDLHLQNLRGLHRSQGKQEQNELRWLAALGLLSGITMSSALVFVVQRALIGELTLGDITLYLGAVTQIQIVLTDVISTASQINQNLLFYNQFEKLMELEESAKSNARIFQLNELKSGIEIRNVSFRYSPEQPWVLKNINLFIEVGKCLALVGFNGAGKSTLIKLLSRLYEPTEGQILWDGVDIRNFDPVKFREKIGAVLQDFVRYDLTVRENIGVGDVNYIDNDECIRAAATKADIECAINNLSNKYDTHLINLFTEVNDGINLSGGQWQKIALARVLMRKADLLILDEPTASLDAHTEHEFYSRFARISNGKTSILISHRFGTIQMADKIAVIENGYVSEYGSHKELLSHRGTYFRLFKMQADRYVEG